MKKSLKITLEKGLKAAMKTLFLNRKKSPIKIMIFTLLFSIPSISVFANSAQNPPADVLVELVFQQSNDILMSDENIRKLAEATLNYHQLEPTAVNVQTLSKTIKHYYLQPKIQQKSKHQMADIYQKTMTDDEIKQWIKFFKTPIGASILKNKAYFQDLAQSIEELFPTDQEPTQATQNKIMDLMMKDLSK